MKRFSRRRFLQISAGSAAAAAVAGTLTEVAASAGGPGEIRKVPTYCDICFWKCAAVAYLRDGKLWKIEGNPDDPLSRGRLCPRGTGGVGAYTDPDRLTAPLLRTKNRGDEQWTAVTWDEALGYVAERMQGIKERYGPESMAMFSHGIGGTFLKHTMRA